MPWRPPGAGETTAPFSVDGPCVRLPKRVSRPCTDTWSLPFSFTPSWVARVFSTERDLVDNKLGFPENPLALVPWASRHLCPSPRRALCGHLDRPGTSVPSSLLPERREKGLSELPDSGQQPHGGLPPRSDSQGQSASKPEASVALTSAQAGQSPDCVCVGVFVRTRYACNRTE